MAKSVAEGVNYTVVGAVQDTAEGVNQVVGGTLQAVKGTVEGAKQSVEAGLDAVKDTAEGAKQSVEAGLDAVKDTAQDLKQSAKSGLDAVKDTAQDLKQSDDSILKVAKERRIIDNSPVNTSEVGSGEFGSQTSDLSASTESEPNVDQNMYVDPEMSMAAGERDLHEGQGMGMETFPQTGDI